MVRAGPILLLLLVLAVGARAEDDRHAPTGVFSRWEAATFTRAKRERRIIVLMVSTTWCHWCHVMKRGTYGDAAVQAVLRRHFLPILVDADARPDLAERFRNYRWPTTAFLTPDAEPVMALRGHRYPKAFFEILADVRRRVSKGGPYPGFEQPSRATGSRFTGDKGLERLRDRLRRELSEHYDRDNAGWGTRHKYPVPEPVEYGLWRFDVDGPATAAYRRAMATLAATEGLIDREWGGVYQYSVGDRWDRWHPEKIMSVNAGALLTYATAFRITGDERWLSDARAVVAWLERFMKAPDGRFHGTQDADAPRLAGEKFYRLSAKERVPYGIPRVNPPLYTKDNAEAALGLLALHRVTGEAEPLAAARRCLSQVRKLAERADGSVLHAAERPGGPLFLIDHALLGRALLALHQASDPAAGAPWLAAARRVAAAMGRLFQDKRGGGFFDVADDTASTGVFARRLKSLEPNAVAARFLLELFAVTEEGAYEAAARGAITAVGTDAAIDAHWRYSAGLLLACEQLLRPWARIELVGDARLPGWPSAWRRARSFAASHPAVVWTTRGGKPGQQPTALICGPGFCSDPLTDLEALEAQVRYVLAAPDFR